MNAALFIQYLTPKAVERWQMRYTLYVQRCLKRGEIPHEPDRWLKDYFAERARKVRNRHALTAEERERLESTFRSLIVSKSVG